MTMILRFVTFFLDLTIFMLLCYNVVRQSIDLYGSLPSPSPGFLGNSSLSRFESSFSSLTRRHTPESLPAVRKPLLVDEEAAKRKRSSHSLLPSKASSRVSHEMGISNDSSFGQAVLNGEFHQTTW